jgi:hypothetical protein
VVQRPADFPTLITWLHAQWYCAWIAARDRRPPGRDRLDDFRHLIESAQCAAFVTGESKLVAAGQVISPSRPCITWASLKADL